MKDGAENVGEAGHDDEEADEPRCNGEGAFDCGEDADVEEEDGTFGEGYGEAVDYHPGHEPLALISSFSRLSAPRRGDYLSNRLYSLIHNWD